MLRKRIYAQCYCTAQANEKKKNKSNFCGFTVLLLFVPVITDISNSWLLCWISTATTTKNAGCMFICLAQFPNPKTLENRSFKRITVQSKHTFSLHHHFVSRRSRVKLKVKRTEQLKRASNTYIYVLDVTDICLFGMAIESESQRVEQR